MSDKTDNCNNETLERITATAKEMAALGVKGIELSMGLTTDMIERFNLKDFQGNRCNCSGRYSCFNNNFLEQLYGDRCRCGSGNSTTDMKLDANLREVRQMSFTIENNRKEDSDYNVTAGDFTDQDGRVFSPSGIITIENSKGVLKAGESVRIDFAVATAGDREVAASTSLKSATAYYTDFAVDGTHCSGKVSLGLWIRPVGESSHLMLCDPCRPKVSDMVQFNDCCCEGSVKSSKIFYRN
jgi:hypothetical protein